MVPVFERNYPNYPKSAALPFISSSIPEFLEAFCRPDGEDKDESDKDSRNDGGGNDVEDCDVDDDDDQSRHCKKFYMNMISVETSLLQK